MARTDVNLGGPLVPPEGAPAAQPATTKPEEPKAPEAELAVPVEQPKRRQKGGE